MRAPEQPVPTTTPLIRTTNGNVNPVAKVASRKATKNMMTISAPTTTQPSFAKPTMVMSPQLSGGSLSSRSRNNKLAQASPSSSRMIDDKTNRADGKMDDRGGSTTQDLMSIQEDGSNTNVGTEEFHDIEASYHTSQTGMSASEGMEVTSKPIQAFRQEQQQQVLTLHDEGESQSQANEEIVSPIPSNLLD